MQQYKHSMYKNYVRIKTKYFISYIEQKPRILIYMCVIKIIGSFLTLLAKNL